MPQNELIKIEPADKELCVWASGKIDFTGIERLPVKSLRSVHD